MEGTHLDGYIYHMMHFQNLPSIFREGALLSNELLAQRKIAPHSIAFANVQDLRARIFIYEFCEQRYRALHSYVPFYFAIRPPMLHVPHISAIQDQLVILEISRSILQNKGVVFTDGNATNQQLTHFDTQYIAITLATLHRALCERRYYPDGNPHGTNVNRSAVFADVAFLDRLEWDVIFDRPGRRFINEIEEYRRIRSAEVLIPDKIGLDQIEGIAVRSVAMVQAVNGLIASSGIEGQVPFAVCKPYLFL